MRQLLLPESPDDGKPLTLREGDFHYLVHVLRKQVGDSFRAVDPSGRRWQCTVAEIGRTECTIRVVDPPPAETVSPSFPSITVYQAVPKGSRFDEAIRQLVQTGVTGICPIECDRSVVRLGEIAASRLERWQRIAREAVQQSGGSPVTLLAPRTVDDLVADPAALSLLLHPSPLEDHTLHGYLSDAGPRVDLVVGPEGGFSERECRLLTDRGFRPLSLGPQVLRSEAAALFAVAAIRVLVLERRAWQPT
jgi:16S rRNA (uracil1498-N3)-methyltransferase